jgi:hypothetical protein
MIKKPKLPEEVAKIYDCSIVPTTVTIQKGEAKGTYDLRTIDLATAEKLSKAGKYLKEKNPPKGVADKK